MIITCLFLVIFSFSIRSTVKVLTRIADPENKSLQSFLIFTFDKKKRMRAFLIVNLFSSKNYAYFCIYLSNILRGSLITIENCILPPSGRPILIIYFENVTSNRSEKLNIVCSPSSLCVTCFLISFHFILRIPTIFWLNIFYDRPAAIINFFK